MDFLRFRRERRAHQDLGREIRILWDRRDPFLNISDIEFRRHYRFTKEGVLNLTNLLGERLTFQGPRGSPLTPLQQVCLVLMFYGSATFQHTAGYMAGVKKSCANTTIKRVTLAICELAAEFIKLPTRAQMRETSNFFEDRYGLPNFAMGVDGTHVRLGLAPREADLPEGIHVQDFWCRKQFYSINVQIIGNEKKLLYNLVARWAGSTHDSRIWKNSNGKTWIESQDEFLVAADSAYPISRSCMKPYIRPETQSQRRFNIRLSGIRTHCTENLIGIWKRRFPCLQQGLRTKLELSTNIIVALGVLHNIAIIFGEPDPDDNEEESVNDEAVENDAIPELEGPVATRVAGQLYRDWLVDNFC